MSQKFATAHGNTLKERRKLPKVSLYEALKSKGLRQNLSLSISSVVCRLYEALKSKGLRRNPDKGISRHAAFV